MTTFDEAAVESLAAERRQHSSRGRISWASERPFAPPKSADLDAAATEGFDPVLLAERRRASWTRPLVLRAVGGDAAIAATVIVLAMASLPAHRHLAPVGAVLAMLLWPLMLAWQSAYDSRLIGQGPEEFQSILRSAVLVIAGLGLTAFSLHLLLPRRYVLIGVPLAAGVTALHRYTLRRWLHANRHQGRALLRTIVVGNPSAIDRVVRDLSGVTHHGYQIVGACMPGVMMDVATSSSTAVLGTLSDVPQTVVDHQADVVIVAGAGLSDSSLRRLSWALERTGADLVVAPGLVEVAGPRLTVRPTAGLSLLHVHSPSSRSSRLLGKALLDRSLGTAIFLLALPIVLVGAALVAVTSKGNPFFCQERIGKDGRSFAMWKLRTMVIDAEKHRSHLLEMNDRDGLMFKMRIDPRVTPVGRWLRRLSIDELPQLWNVVTGSMSLVGPRPPLREEYERYHDHVHRRLRVKPGLTGLWQVSGRADLTWEESIRLDLRYVDNWSVAMDLLILWKTARAVLRGSGAY